VQKFIKATLIGGVLFLVPLALVALVAGKAFALIHKLVAPIADVLNLSAVLGINASRVLAIVALVLVCFVAGLFARTSIARRLMSWLESSVLSMLPGYQLVASLTGDASLTRDHSAAKPEVVLASIEDAWQFALVVERIGSTHVVVYVPDAPSATSGSVYVMTADRVKPVDVTLPEMAKCLKGLGVGTRAVFGHRAVTSL
jgi:uncharacterized membrane protein